MESVTLSQDSINRLMEMEFDQEKISVDDLILTEVDQDGERLGLSFKASQYIETTENEGGYLNPSSSEITLHEVEITEIKIFGGRGQYTITNPELYTKLEELLIYIIKES